jgi:adenosylhomocysteine nucleosidase
MLAIVSAMPEEISAVLEALADVEVREFGGRAFHEGTLSGVRVVVVFSRLGKVAAAVTATQLVSSFPVTQLVFGGVAGGVRPGLSIGDVVIATELIQHDMDARPIFPRYEIPLLGRARFAADPDLSARLGRAADEFVARDLRSQVSAAELDFFGITAPRVVRGVVASGDKFFASTAEVQELRSRLPEVCCVEMEGAAVAQVCSEYEVPFAVVRTISDSADESSVHDFPRFSREIARHYPIGVLRRFLASATAVPSASEHAIAVQRG